MTKKGVKAPVALEADLNAAVIYVSTDLKQWQRDWQQRRESPQGKPKARNEHVCRENHLPLPSRRNMKIGILPMWQKVISKLQFSLAFLQTSCKFNIE